MNAAAVLALQCDAGNHTVSRLLARSRCGSAAAASTPNPGDAVITGELHRVSQARLARQDPDEAPGPDQTESVHGSAFTVTGRYGRSEAWTVQVNQAGWQLVG
jgi:hypothetical protein